MWGTRGEFCINLLYNVLHAGASFFQAKLLTNSSPEEQVGVDKSVYTKCIHLLQENMGNP